MDNEGEFTTTPETGIPSWKEVTERFMAQQEKQRNLVGELLRAAPRRFATEPRFHWRVLALADFWNGNVGRPRDEERNFQYAIEAVTILDALEELS